MAFNEYSLTKTSLDRVQQPTDIFKIITTCTLRWIILKKLFTYIRKGFWSDIQPKANPLFCNSLFYFSVYHIYNFTDNVSFHGAKWSVDPSSISTWWLLHWKPVSKCMIVVCIDKRSWSLMISLNSFAIVVLGGWHRDHSVNIKNERPTSFKINQNYYKFSNVIVYHQPYVSTHRTL